MALEDAVHRLALAMETQNGLIIEMLDRLSGGEGGDTAPAAGAEQPAKRGRGRPRKEEAKPTEAPQTAAEPTKTPEPAKPAETSQPLVPTEDNLDDDLGLDDAPAPAKTYTLEEVRAKLIEVKNAKGQDSAKAIIQAHVSANTSPVVGNIPADKYAACVAACEKALK